MAQTLMCAASRDYQCHRNVGWLDFREVLGHHPYCPSAVKLDHPLLCHLNVLKLDHHRRHHDHCGGGGGGGGGGDRHLGHLRRQVQHQ